MRAEVAQETLKATPPVAVTLWAWLSEATLNEWVLRATLFYIVLQAGYLIFKWVSEIRRGR